MDRRIDMAVAFGFMALGLIIILEASGIRGGIMRDPVGPRAAFYVCGGILLLGGAITVARHWRALATGAGRMVADEGNADNEGIPAHFRRAAALAVICFAYAALFNPLGYLLATPLFILAALRVMEQRNWLANALIAVVFTVVAYLVFARVLGVRMPHGPLTDLFRQLGWITL